MKTKHYLILAAALLLLCFVYINTVGDHISSDFMIYGEERDPKAYSFKIENEEVLALTGMSVGDGFVRGEFESLAPGNTIVYLSDGSNIMNGQMFYVHRSGLITEDTIYGRCTGGEVFPAAAAVILALLLYDSVKRLKKSMAEDLYRYANIRDTGLVIYLSAFLLLELVSVFNFKGLLNAACLITDTAQTILFFSFPLVFLTSVMVSLSNLKLMRNEGKSLKNMLGFILGLLFCVGILFPEIMNAFLQRTTLVDVHNQRGIALYIFLFIENIIYVMVAYLECMLIGTIVIAVKAARAVPPFDRDCIMILGCRVAKDGSLTRLLKGRADRALEFARMQKERSGKDIIFIPSGGKGADEPVSEAEAVKNYLLSCGVPEDHIITEDKSADTFENMKNSKKIIEELFPGQEARPAFSTTNYHVFRSGVIASELAMAAKGIGSPTRSYFWINAFIREFVALLYSERRTHIRIIAMLVLIVTAVVYMNYRVNII